MKQKLLIKTKHTRSTHCASWTFHEDSLFMIREEQRSPYGFQSRVRVVKIVVFCENASYLKVSSLCIIFAWVNQSWWTWRLGILRWTHLTVSGLLNKCIYFLFLSVYFPYQRHEPRSVKYIGALDCRLIWNLVKRVRVIITVLGAKPSETLEKHLNVQLGQQSGL